MLAWIGCVSLGIWIATGGFPVITDQGEVFFAYLAGKNFIRFGLFETYFIENVASSVSAEAHPFFYTHNPDSITKLLSYALQCLRITDIRWHILVSIPVFLLGQWYFYKLSRRFLGERGGLWVLFFGATGYLMSLSWSLNFYRAWSWPLCCGAWFHLTAIDGTKDQRNRWLHFGLFIFWLWLLSSHYYSFLLFFTIVVFAFKCFGLVHLSWKQLFLCWLLVPVPLVMAHQLTLIGALGLETWGKDWVYTIGNRTFGIPSRSELQEFFDRAGIVLWGYEGGPVVSEQELQYAWSRLRLALGSIGAVVAIVGSFATIALSIWSLWRDRKQGAIQGWDKSIRFVGALAFGVVCMASIGPKDFMLVSLSFFFPTIVFFAYPCLALVVVLLGRIPRAIATWGFGGEGNNSGRKGVISIRQQPYFWGISMGRRQNFLVHFSIRYRLLKDIQNYLLKPARLIRLSAGAIAGFLWVFVPTTFCRLSSQGELLVIASPDYAIFLLAYLLVLWVAVGCIRQPWVLMNLFKASREPKSTIWNRFPKATLTILALLLIWVFYRLSEQFFGSPLTIRWFAGLLGVGFGCWMLVQLWRKYVKGREEPFLKKSVTIAVASLACMGLILVPYGKAQILSWQSQPPAMLPGAAILKNYKGHTFITNQGSAYVSYFTGNWTIHVHAQDLDGTLDKHAIRYAFERDKLVNPDYLHPDFYLCGYPANIDNFPCFASEAVAERFSISDSGAGWLIYDLRGSKNELER